MRPLRFVIRHKEMHLISDRSARRVLKTVGKAVRRAQVEELTRFVFKDLDLDYSRTRALADQINNQAELHPAFYLEKLKRGSLILAGVASVTLIGVLVRDLINRAVDDDADRQHVLSRLKDYLVRDWSRNVAKLVAADLKERGLGNHTAVSDCKIKSTEAETVLRMEFETTLDDDGEERVREDEITEKDVDRLIQDGLDDLE